MHPTNTNPTQRFSDRVENYVRYRPSYPKEVLSILQEETELTFASVIADVGSGTGISTKLFLENGNTVYGVEPNQQMRQAAEAFLQDYPHFRSIAGTAEATTLPDQLVDHVVAAQAFHWFDIPPTKQEFNRILKPDGWVVLLWNARRLDTTPFLQVYEALLQQYGTDYQQIGHKNSDIAALGASFSKSKLIHHTLSNEQVFDFEGLKGRLLSSSYVPNKGHANFQPMLQQLTRIFEQHEQEGAVHIKYDTELYFGQLG